MRRSFTKQEIEDLDLPYNKSIVKSDEIIEVTRWSIVHQLVFKHDNKYWRCLYREGATELQDESPFEYDDVVEATEVELKDVTVKVWIDKIDE